MRVSLDKYINIGTEFLQLKYRNPVLATHSERTAVGQYTLDWVVHTDNLVLLFEVITNLELALHLSFTTFKRYHLEINISKTKTKIFNHQHINEEYPKTIVSINNAVVENTISFKYRGCNIKCHEPSIGASELEILTGTTQCKFYELEKK